MNFNEYITNDIEEKKVILNVLPKNTPVRKRKVEETLINFRDKYYEIKDDIAKFINYKYNKIYPKENNIDVSKELEEIKKLKNMLVIGNNFTSYYEKMGFDIIMYNLMHYYELSIIDINNWIYEILLKFKLIGVSINANDFELNFHAYLYMKSFFDNYEIDKTNTSFYEKIYWKCPKVIEYIIIIFRMLVRKYSLKFKYYCKTTYIKQLKSNNFSNQKDILDKLHEYIKIIDSSTNETEYDIIKLCLEGKFDYKILIADDEALYNNLKSFMIKPIDINDKVAIDNYIISVKNLKHDLKEYYNYVTNVKIVEDIRKKYSNTIQIKDKKSNFNQSKSKLKEILALEKQAKRNRIQIKTENLKDLNYELTEKNKELLFHQELILDNIYKEYINYNNIYFDEVLKNFFKISSLVSDLYRLIVFYPSYGRKLIKKTFDLDSEEEISKYMQNFENLLFNPYRKVIDMIPLFLEKDVPQMLMNGFRFENLDIKEDSMEESNMQLIFEKCNKIIRKTKANEFNLSNEEIKFLVDVKKLKDQQII